MKFSLGLWDSHQKFGNLIQENFAGRNLLPMKFHKIFEKFALLRKTVKWEKQCSDHLL